ncbi:MAG: hypothetical protein R3B91_19500 [Planctomycetaceae bacterium]
MTARPLLDLIQSIIQRLQPMAAACFAPRTILKPPRFRNGLRTQAKRLRHDDPRFAATLLREGFRSRHLFLPCVGDIQQPRLSSRPPGSTVAGLMQTFDESVHELPTFFVGSW